MGLEMEPPSHKALAFGCARVYSFDFASEPILHTINMAGRTLHQCFGTLYRMVQSKFVNCHSTNEAKQSQQDMKCVNRKEVRSCHKNMLYFKHQIDAEQMTEKEHTKFCRTHFTDEIKQAAYTNLNDNV